MRQHKWVDDQHHTVPDPPAHGDQFPTRPMTLLGVWAHPDDESYLSAVLMSRVVKVGGRVVLVSATRGEAGGSGGTDELARLREHELRTAMASLCVRDVRFLGYGDGECAYADAEEAIESIIALIEDVRPDVIVTSARMGSPGIPTTLRPACGPLPQRPPWVTNDCSTRP